MSDCVRCICEFALHRSALDRIAIRPQPPDLAVSDTERRTLQIFGRKRNGTAVDLTSLSGGLSSSRILKVIVRDANGAALITAVAKVAPIPQIRDEAQRFQTYISRLAPGGFPSLTEQIEVGAGNSGGLFYGMIGDDVESLFHRIATRQAGIATIPSDLRLIESTWYQAKRTQAVQIAQIRRHLIGDAALHEVKPQLDGIEIADIEARVVDAAHCVQHGDLHCANVMFDQRGRAMLIDFGDAGASFASIDPVTLELSTIFHSQHTTLPQGWPTEFGISQWVTPERYTDGCEFAPFISECRAWALAEAASPDEVVAVAYAYALRQLQYCDTDKTLARGLIRACIVRWSHFVGQFGSEVKVYSGV